MSQRDTERRFKPDAGLLDNLGDRKRAEQQIAALRDNEALRSEIRALREQGPLEIEYAPEKGEAQHLVIEKVPISPGEVPDEAAPRVKIAANTEGMSKDELDKLRIPTGPAPLPADHTMDGRLADTNLSRNKASYRPEEQAAARAAADAIFAEHKPGTEEFLRGVALCHKYDLKLPDVDVDAIQAASNEAVREALTAKSAPSTPLGRLQPHLNLDAANLPPSENEVHEEERRARAWVWLLLPIALLGGVFVAWRWLAAPETAAPISVPTGTGVTATVALPAAPETATPIETTSAVETSAPTTTAAPTPRTTEPVTTNLAPRPTSARPTASVAPSAAPQASSPSPGTSSGVTPTWQ